MASNNRTNLTIHQVEAIANTAGARAMETLHGDVQRLWVAVERLTEKVDGMADVMLDMEKTIRMFLIANWDKFQDYLGPPPAFPSPPREARGGGRGSGSK